MATETIPWKVLQNGKTDPNRPAYYVRSGSGWSATSWGEYASQVSRTARALIALGVELGQPVAVIGWNRPEWVVFDVGAMAAGAVPAGIYTTSSPDEVRYILDHSEAPVILVEDEHQWSKVHARKGELSHLRHVVTMQGAPPVDDDLVMTWEEFMAKGDEVSEAQLNERLEALRPEDLGTLIYTSGTTGPPKGVMLSHDNLAWTATQGARAADLQPDDFSVSYLPLSHIAEQLFSIHAPATARSSIYFAESIDKLQENLESVQPTVFFAVPRVWEKFQSGIADKLGEATGIRAKIASWAMGVGRKVTALKARGQTPGGPLAVQYAIAKRLVFDKVKPVIGLSRAKVTITSAAPISKETLEFFAGLDILVTEVYGQSEDTGPTTMSLPGRTKLGSVGPPFPGVEVKIAGDGEILVKGRNVFLGYYKDEAATKETLIDGWLHSGDLGVIDDEGFLNITGRKKDIIITAGGKNVAPKLFESGLKNHELVSEVVMIGDRRKYLTALVTLDEEHAAKFLDDQGIDQPAHDSDVVREAIQKAVDEVNGYFARVEQVKKFAILPRQLTIEDGELTPTLKVKRNVVAERFADTIEALYRD